MSFTPTPSQRDAITHRGSSVLVSAGAGSGKTRVLTERLMACITEDGVDLDRFVIITFTKAAAQELKSRILDSLSERLALNADSARLRRQRALIDRAAIGTIHSFCGMLLRENCHLLSLSPDFAIAEDDRAKALKSAALERVLESRYAGIANDPGFAALADTVGAGRDDRRLSELTVSLHDKMQSHARPALWAQQQTALLTGTYSDISETPWGQEIIQNALRLCRFWSQKLESLLEEMRGCEKIFTVYSPAIAQYAEKLRELERLLTLGRWDESKAHFPGTVRLSPLRNSPMPSLSERVKAIFGACRETFDKLEKAFPASSAQLLAELKASAAPMSALLSLVLDFDREYSEAKRRANLLDYSDLEHMAAQLLTHEDGSPTALARSLSERYAEIMVDEYQDVSLVQDVIFRAVSRNGHNLFLVGDIKQSIYRFRLADPTIFTEKYHRFAPVESAAPGEDCRILLRENFRSRPEILECANRVFSLCMSEELGDIEYDEAAALVCGRKVEDSVPTPELLLLDLSQGEEDRLGKTELEARMVAQKIRSLIDSNTLIPDGETQRPLRYHDIAILMRAASAAAPVYRRVLSEYGIPVSCEQGSDFFRSVEVSTVTSMLALLENPHRDIPLIAVLRSPAVGLSADELSAIRACDRSADLYTALTKAANAMPRCAAFLEMLHRLRTVSPELSETELLRRIYAELDLLAVCAAMRDGERRYANLLTLLSLAERFEGSSACGLPRFLQWLQKLSEGGATVSSGGSDASAVQIMTVHKSKGLEFPVVFLCGTAQPFSVQDLIPPVLVHPELGLGPKVVDEETHSEYPSLARLAISRRMHRENLSEEMRLLYVALTRARDRMFITAALRDVTKKIEKLTPLLASPLPSELLLDMGCHADWLLAAALIDNGQHIRLSVLSPEEPAATAAKAEAVPGVQSTQELSARLSFVYPHAEASELPSKLTATALKTEREPEPDDGEALLSAPPRPFRVPDFEKAERPLTGAERGVATHLVLQYIDFSRTETLSQIRDEIARLTARRMLSPREAESVDARAILTLFRSELGQRMRRAERVQREFKFSLLIPAQELLGRGGEEELLLQGVIDCFLVENGEITIIDYKTDAVRTEEELAERTQHYSPQLSAYAAALTRILSLPVRSCVLWYIRAGRAAELTKKSKKT